MKKILFSLFMMAALTVSVSAQDVKKECKEAAKKECCEAKKEHKEGCCTEKKAEEQKEKACCAKKEATAETKSCGKK
jgi:hypothetical protein